MANEETLKVVDYIDRFEVLNLLSKEADFFANPPMDKEDYAKLKLLLEIKFKIDRLPTADVEEVRHGEWIEEFAKSTINRLTGEDSTIVYRCSRCGRYESQKEPYCNCGAKMDGGK